MNLNRNFYSVSQINSYIKSLFEEDVILREIFIQGEISNFTNHSSGTLYFNLKDENASINCIMFRNSTGSLKFMPKNGDKVMIFGRISLYEKTGNYQVYVELMESFGLGELHLKFEALKNKLESEGLFDSKYKREIPKNPKKVGLITSPTSAAVRDMIKMGRNINPNISLIIIPTLMQGEDSPKDIINSIDIANKYGECDYIILSRGGGSIEDLWSFNDENVARSIFDSKIPIVTGIGHETDFTIADFVSDLRAPTPSAAISMTFPSLDLVKDNIVYLVDRLNLTMEDKIFDLEYEINTLDFKNIYKNIEKENTLKLEKIISLNKRLNIQIDKNLKENKNEIGKYISLLSNLSPLNVLKRGYSIALKEGENINTIKDIKIDEEIEVLLKDGKLKAKVEEISKGDIYGK